MYMLDVETCGGHPCKFPTKGCVLPEELAYHQHVHLARIADDGPREPIQSSWSRYRKRVEEVAHGGCKDPAAANAALAKYPETLPELPAGEDNEGHDGKIWSM